MRARGPGWRDPRLWLGIALVAASVLVGARLLGGADDTVEVWSAAPTSPRVSRSPRRIWSPGGCASTTRPTAIATSGSATRCRATPPLSRAVGAGELLPAAALGAAEEGLTEVPVWAPAEVIPASIEPGSTVDVWVTPTPGSGSTVKGSVLVLDDVVVIAVPRGEDSFGPGGNRQVLVGVTDGAAPEVGQALAAAKDNRIVITRQG